MNGSAGLRRWAIVIVLLQRAGVLAWFEFCAPDSNIYTASHDDCPFGVLFKEPQAVGSCLSPSDAPDMFADVCAQDFDVSEAKKLHQIDVGQDDDDGPSSGSGYSESSCQDKKGGDPDKCGGEYVRITLDTATWGRDGGGGGEGGEGAGDGDRPDLNDTTIDRTNIDVRNQTLRLFLYMNDLLVDENDNLPVLRLVKLLKKSFDVLKTHCSPKYVSQDFGKEIFKAFQFLLRESDLAHVKDITVTEFAKINAVLDRCLKGKPPFPFYLNGTICKATTKIDNIIKTWQDENKGDRKVNRTHPFIKNSDFAFKWGKYDVPVDATWSVMDFTHGMCYGTFKTDMNSHHLYEQALERLFTAELRYRWARPVRLTNEFFWDNVFRSYVLKEMINLDACIQASYLGSPYLHRLARPIAREQQLHGVGKRRKREAGSILSSAWCLQSQEEKDKAYEALKVEKPTCNPPQNQ